MKIRDLVVNQIVTIPLVVLSATARETRAKKPYLSLEFFDGSDKITGNYWDWTSGKIPEVNAILDVKAQVTEYMGAKQLNVHTINLNTTKHLSEFQPSANVDMSAVYKEAYSLVSSVQDDFLRSVALDALEQLMQMWLTVPGAKGVHHAFVGGTLVHCLSVAKIALAISRELPDSNDDLCLVGGLLHDIGKLFTYTVDGLVISLTDEGTLYDHTYLGARFVSNFAEPHLANYPVCGEDKLALLEHIILSHHGELEYGAAVPPMCIEAHIVHKADGVDATVQQVIEASRKVGEGKWTDRVYTLNNRPQLTTWYMHDLFGRRSLPF